MTDFWASIDMEVGGKGGWVMVTGWKPPMMPEISFSISGIRSILLDLDSNKSPSPDSMPTS